MVGAMTISMVKFNTVLSFSMKGEELMNVQEILDSIFKGIVPLLVTLSCFKLLDKKSASSKLFLNGRLGNFIVITWNRIGKLQLLGCSFF